MLKINRFYEFGSFRLDPAERLLRRDSQAVPLPPKAFDTLLLLVEHSGHLLTKQQMLQSLWPETFVEEANLAQNISTIRRALGEQEGGERYIETVPKAGYRFVAETRSLLPEILPEEPIPPASAPIERAPETSTRRSQSQRRIRAAGVALAVVATLVGLVLAWRARADPGKASRSAAATQVRSIAVLPLVNLSNDPAQEYFSDGLTDELITKVAQVGSLQVISRTSVMAYKHSLKKAPEIGAELHVDSILEGTVERVGNRVRIRVQLIRTPADQHLWAESYDREIKDVLSLESDVARDVAQRIGQLRVTPQPQPARHHLVPNEAHEQYLRGRYRWNQRTEAGLRAGISHFESALDLDPLYPQAYAGLADSYLMLANWGFIAPSEGYSKAKAAARRALELDDRLADAQTSLAYVQLLNDWDWPAAETRFRRALELNPNYATAHHFYSVYLMAASRHPEAQTEIERARDLDPLSPIINSVVGWIYYEGRRYDKAMEQSRRTVEMNPDYGPSLLDLGNVHLVRADYENALKLFRRARTIMGDTTTVLSYLAQSYARSGNTTVARELLHRLERPASKFVSPWELALVYAALGDRNQAQASLEKAADERAGWIVLIGVDPGLDSLRIEPRFRSLEERIGVPQPNPVIDKGR